MRDVSVLSDSLSPAPSDQAAAWKSGFRRQRRGVRLTDSSASCCRSETPSPEPRATLEKALIRRELAVVGLGGAILQCVKMRATAISGMRRNLNELSPQLSLRRAKPAHFQPTCATWQFRFLHAIANQGRSIAEHRRQIRAFGPSGGDWRRAHPARSRRDSHIAYEVSVVLTHAGTG